MAQKLSYFNTYLNQKHMIYTKFKTAALFTMLAITVVACKKKDDPVTTGGPDPSGTGTVGFEFNNYVGDKELDSTTSFTVGGSQTITVTKFNYFISNIRLKKSDGTEYAESESYHVVKQTDGASKHFHLKNVPAGNYVAVSFMIGVDSARNTSGAQTGGLDPYGAAKDMYWDWNTGYIMAKLEGSSPQAGSADHKFMHHIGGFKGANSAVRTVTLNFPFTAVLASGKELSIPVKANLAKWFEPNNVSLATNPDIMTVSTVSKSIADNYANMFSLLPMVIE